MIKVHINNYNPTQKSSIHDLGYGVYVGWLIESGVEILLMKMHGRAVGISLSNPDDMRSWGENTPDSKHTVFADYKKINITHIEGDEISE